MQIVCLSISVLLFIYACVRRRCLFNPDVFMYGVWAVVIFLNALSLFGIKPADDEVYLLVTAGMCSYLAGTVIYDIFSKVSIFPSAGSNKQYSRTHLMNYRFIYLMAYITIFFLLIDLFIAVRYMMRGYSFVQVRTWMTETYSASTNPIMSRRSFIEQIFRVMVLSPFQMAVNPLCAVDFFFGNRSKRLLILTLVIQLMGIVAGGGARLGVILLGVSFITTYSIFIKKYGHKNRKVAPKKRRMRLLILVGCLAVAFLTLRRSSVRILEEAYYYFALCMPLLSYWLPIIKTYGHTHGMMSLFGIARVPFLALDKVGIYTSGTYTRAYEYMIAANTFHNIGHRVANSFVTPYYYMYIDGGYFAVIIGMILIGIIASKVYRKVVQTYDLKAIYFMLMIDIGLFYTFIRLETTATNYVFALIFAVFFFKRSYRNDLDNTDY